MGSFSFYVNILQITGKKTSISKQVCILKPCLVTDDLSNIVSESMDLGKGVLGFSVSV